MDPTQSSRRRARATPASRSRPAPLFLAAAIGVTERRAVRNTLEFQRLTKLSPLRQPLGQAAIVDLEQLLQREHGEGHPTAAQRGGDPEQLRLCELVRALAHE